MHTRRTDHRIRSAIVLIATIMTGLGVGTIGLSQPATTATGAEIRVAIDQGDLRGGDQRALQAAVDHVAGLGGGTVHIGPGRYPMRNALTLRDHVRIVGEPGKTILVACE